LSRPVAKNAKRRIKLIWKSVGQPPLGDYVRRAKLSFWT
jgi:hypothetical protein